MKLQYTKKSIVFGILSTLLLFGLIYICYGICLNGSTFIRMIWALTVGFIISTNPQIKAKKYIPYFLYGMTIIAAILLGFLCLTDNLAYDEGYTIALIRHDITSLFEITSQDVHTPFYYLIAKGFLFLFGDHVQGVKVCSLVFTLLYLLLGVFPIRKEFGSKVAFYFVFFSVTFPCFTVHGTNPRMYAMSLFFLTATGLLAYKLYRNFSVKTWILFILASICSIYSHTFALISTVIIFLMLMVALFRQKEIIPTPSSDSPTPNQNDHNEESDNKQSVEHNTFKKDKRKQILFFFLAAILVSLSFLPWLFVLWGQFQNRLSSGESIGILGNTYSMIDYLAEWFSSTENVQPLSILVGLLLVIIACYHITFKKPTHYVAVILGALVFTITSAIGIYLTSKVSPCYTGRYTFPAFGFVVLLIALGMTQIKNKRFILIILATYMCIGALHYKDVYKLEHDTGLKDFKEFMDDNTTPLDGVIYSSVHTQCLSNYYPDLTNFIYGYKAPLNPFPNSVAFKDYKQLEEVMGNLWYIDFTDGNAPPFDSSLYTCEEAFSFHYMYYDITIYKMICVQ